jgi:hypothetical protein
MALSESDTKPFSGENRLMSERIVKACIGLMVAAERSVVVYLRVIALISMIVIYEDGTNVPVWILPGQNVAAWIVPDQNQKSAIDMALTANMVRLYNLNHLFPGCPCRSQT